MSFLLKKDLQRISGWITTIRHANARLSFANLRFDENGIKNIQLVLDRAKTTHLTPESSVTVEGFFTPKLHSTTNEEFQVQNIKIHNTSESPLPLVLHEDQNEDIRLRYRYLDLRRPYMLNNLTFRSRFIHKLRCFFQQNSFLEIETPLLFKSTPEGAKEFIVKGENSQEWALPQSPQQFKQMLIIGGIPKYFQIAKCFRNEDLRSDRQPEFTQLDLEMSFADENNVKKTIEECLKYTLENVEFTETNFKEAMKKYGSDKPIIHPLEIETIESDVGLIEESIDIIVNDHFIIQNAFERDSTPGTISKQIKGKKLITQRDDRIYPGTTCLGKMRNLMIKNKQVTSKGYKFLWVNNFPLFDTSGGLLKTMHHPFTAPHPDDIHLLNDHSQYQNIRGIHYDLILDGLEVGGGSVRIHNSSLQSQVFDILKIDGKPFSHLLEALKFGAPPHAGIALGLDRLISVLCNTKSIRDIIAFPKNSSGKDLLFNN